MRVRVTEVIEEDSDRVLFAGMTDESKRVTFHIRRDPKGRVDQLVELVNEGNDQIYVEV
jgi:hypothetical protein